MISCLPATPGYAWVRRIDWMISFALRSYTLPSNADCGRRRARTSCCVIVEPPRSRPLSVSIAAEMNPAGSKPAFSQNVLSSTDVVASIRPTGMSLNATTSRRSSPSLASSMLPVRS